MSAEPEGPGVSPPPRRPRPPATGTAGAEAGAGASEDPTGPEGCNGGRGPARRPGAGGARRQTCGREGRQADAEGDEGQRAAERSGRAAPGPAGGCGRAGDPPRPRPSARVWGARGAVWKGPGARSGGVRVSRGRARPDRRVRAASGAREFDPNGKSPGVYVTPAPSKGPRVLSGRPLSLPVSSTPERRSTPRLGRPVVTVEGRMRLRAP